MVRIRMQRFGRKNRPFFRIAATDRLARRNGPVIEQLGFYDPLEKDPAKALKINAERVKYWISKGAQPSDTCRDFFAKQGLVDVKAWEAQRAVDRKIVQEKLARQAAEGDKGEKQDAKKEG
jgi:small subunit ribosomal protein S16